MVYKTYISKFNTIVSGSELNTSLNPVSDMVYGMDGVVSRALVYFDHEKVRRLIENGTMCDMGKMRHTLKITNAGSIDFTELHSCNTSQVTGTKRVRAASFDLIFFLIPKPWDRGKGFDYSKSLLNLDFYQMKPIDPDRLISKDACNWFQRMNGLKWDEEGVYWNSTLSAEYDKFSAGEESIVIGRQHFDVGNENISIDITDTFNKFLTGELENNGIGIAFTPMLELSEASHENYLGLMTNKTNTFFEPYVETRYCDVVSDDRSNFVLGKKNRLYLYCNIGDTLQSLDKNPTVTVRNSEDEVIVSGVESAMQQRGIYYIELELGANDFESDTMLYDTWEGISYKGTRLNDVELDFTLKPTPNYFNIGNSLSMTNVSFTPSISGINSKERIKRGDLRKLVISARPNYTSNTVQLVDEMCIRLYVKDGTGEIDVIGWDRVNKSFSENFYMIDTSILIPQRYYVDVRISYGMESIIHHDVLTFDIVNDLDDRHL